MLARQASKKQSWNLYSGLTPKLVFNLCEEKGFKMAPTLTLILRRLNTEILNFIFSKFHLPIWENVYENYIFCFDSFSLIISNG